MSIVEYWFNRKFINIFCGFIIEFVYGKFINVNMYNKGKDCLFFSYSFK